MTSNGIIGIGIIGAAGRMGRAIAAAADEQGVTVAGGVDVGGDLAALASDADVMVDFSSVESLTATLAAARTARTALVIGTTGLSSEDHAAIDAAAGEIAVLQTGNTSLGVTLLSVLVEQAAARLPDWDVEVVEMHHRMKKDAPSGTALLLGAAAAHGRGVPLTPEFSLLQMA